MNWLIQKLTHNWKPKLLSLFFAIVFWTYVQELQYDTVNLAVPIEYVNYPKNLFWRKEPPRFVKISVRGKKDEIKFPTSSLKAIVDLSQAKPGFGIYHVQFDKKQIPEKISISGFNNVVKIEFDRGVLKAMTVKANIQGDVAEGYKKGRITVNPVKVLVEGPAKVLNRLRVLETKPIVINDLKETFTYHTQLSAENSVKMLNGRDIEVTVTVYKQNTTNEKVIENVKIDILGKDPALNVSLSSTTVKIYVRGDSEALKKVDANQYHAYINLDGTRFIQKTLNIMPFDYEPDITVFVKDLYPDKGIELLDSIPASISVRFSVKPEYLKKIEEEREKEKEKNNKDKSPENPTPDSGAGKDKKTAPVP